MSLCGTYPYKFYDQLKRKWKSVMILLFTCIFVRVEDVMKIVDTFERKDLKTFNIF